MARLFCSPSLAAVIIAATATSAAAQDYSHGRRLFLEKADCQYCHGWAGDGAGGGQSPGGAANLRKSQLDRANLITVIRCGIPGTAMPHVAAAALDNTAAARHRGHRRLSPRQGHRARARYT